VNRIAPLSVFVLVTTLLLAFGSYPWSWVAGPLAALALWSLDRKAREPVAGVRVRAQRAPAPVD
jgi:hypothetical protein